MRSWIISAAALGVSLAARQAQAQVAPVATMGGMANPSIGPTNMSIGANTANFGASMAMRGPLSGMGGSYGSSTAASRIGVGSNFAGGGINPLAPGGRYFDQNNNTAMGMNMTAAGIAASTPGQPLVSRNARSMFNGGGNQGGPQNYRPGVSSLFGGASNGMAGGPNLMRGSNRGGYNGGANSVGAPIYGRSNINTPGFGGFPMFRLGYGRR